MLYWRFLGGSIQNRGRAGDTQIVIKPMGRMFRQISGISGSTIMGTGRVALLLDIPALMSEFDDLFQESAAAVH